MRYFVSFVIAHGNNLTYGNLEMVSAGLVNGILTVRGWERMISLEVAKRGFVNPKTTIISYQLLGPDMNEERN